MKKLALLFSLIVITAVAYAQNDKKKLALPIPHYKLLRADSTYITDAALNKNKPVMFIYFAPDCPHCVHLMEELRPKMNEIKDIQIVMVCFTRTIYPYMGLLKNFSRDFDLPKYKNLTMGTEYPSQALIRYFDVETTPFIAIYDSKGKMTQYFNKPAPVADVVAAIKKVLPTS